MQPISTSSTWNSALLNLTQAEQTQTTDGAQVSTGKLASDLGGFGQSSQTITAFTAAQTQLNGYITANQSISARLTVQDSALTEVSTAGTAARNAVTQAIGAGTAAGLIQTLGTQYQQVVDGINTQNNGVYVFGGGVTQTAPISAPNLTALAAAPTVASVFQNGNFKSTSKLDAHTTVQTGILASDVAQPLVTVFQNIAAYDAGPNGPLGDPLTAAQTSFLQSQLSAFDTANTTVTSYQAQNGGVQSEVSSQITDQQNQSTTLTNLISDKTDVDMATALTNLSQAQTAVQASAQVLASLKTDSLLNILPVA
jgi:flagellar hook-associated protein 3 FlgL